MQYLLKLSLQHTEIWRLIAIEGQADLAHVAKLCALAFPYPDSLPLSFKLGDEELSAGVNGKPSKTSELKAFDSLKLVQDDSFEFKVKTPQGELVHTVQIMKASSHLYCLMPSCLVGQGRIAEDCELEPLKLQERYEEQEEQSLDLREVTNRLRDFGSQRKDLNEALLNLGAQPLQFKLLQ